MQGEGLKKLQSGQPISTREQLLLIAQLSWPAILAQISSVVMQYIDTAMVGQLGSNASAAIGVVATTSWLFGDLCIALTIGFNVAVAQALGARQSEKARGIMKLAFLVCMAFSLVMMAIALGITGNLPRWLRADPAIWQDASAYFLVFVLSLPFMQLNNLCGGLLRSAGNMKTPGICMVVMCLLDVVFTLPMVLPPTVVGYFLLLLFGAKRPLGIFFMEHFGVKLVMNWYSAIFASIVVAFPLMYRTARGAFESFDETLAWSAQTLGLSNTWIFWRVRMPCCRQGILAGTVLAFARALGEYGATSMIAGYTPGKTATIATTVYQLWRTNDEAGAMQWVLVDIVISAVVLLAVNLLERRQKQGGKRT